MDILFDTHCHLDLPPLCANLPRHLTEARSVGITSWVVPGVAPSDWDNLLTTCKTDPALLPALGIHPMHCNENSASYLEQLDGEAASAVAIGEIGLDRFYGDPEQQESFFRSQLDIANNHKLPVLIHCRGAISRCLQILKQYRSKSHGGIMHAFSGSLESAMEFIRLGYGISLCGSLTYRGAVRPVRLARELPLDQLVLETDAPDLLPQPHLDTYNQPVFLKDVALKLAEIRELPYHEVAVATTCNAVRLLRLCAYTATD